MKKESEYKIRDLKKSRIQSVEKVHLSGWTLFMKCGKTKAR